MVQVQQTHSLKQLAAHFIWIQSIPLFKNRLMHAYVIIKLNVRMNVN